MKIETETGAILNIELYDYVENVVTGASQKLVAIKVNPPVATDLTLLHEPGLIARMKTAYIQAILADLNFLSYILP